MNRDSLLWWIVIAGAVFTYMASMPSPMEWTWNQWMASGAAMAGIIAGKLSTSPLKGAGE